MTTPALPQNFAATRWTLIARARGSDTEAKAALSDLCAVYYSPVVAFIRAEGRREDFARDLAHEFFARILAGQSLSGADASRGRFRCYLLGAVKHFLADRHDREGAQKRGGGAEHVHLDAIERVQTEPGLGVPAAEVVSPDHAFDRQWALTLIARALEVLAAEFKSAGKEAHFETLKPWLVGIGVDNPSGSQWEAAQKLGLSEGAAKVAIHRLRHRFREVIKGEIAETVAASEVDDELGHLVAVLIRG